MSRYPCYLYQDEKMIDDNCIIGYDEQMGTYFFQSGEETDEGEPIIWLGTLYQEFARLNWLMAKLENSGYTLKIDQEYQEALLADGLTGILSKNIDDILN